MPDPVAPPTPESPPTTEPPAPISELLPNIPNTVEPAPGKGLTLDDIGRIPFSVFPVGIIFPWAGTAAPAGTLLLDGTAKKIGEFPLLFGICGTTYNTGGEGTDEFRLPNYQNRGLMGKGSGTFATLGATGGAETHTLAANEYPSHLHSSTSLSITGAPTKGTLAISSSGAHTHGPTTYAFSDSVQDVPGGTATYFRVSSVGAHNSATHSHTNADFTGAPGVGTLDVSGNTGATGDGEAHNNLQPYLVQNFIVVAG